MLLRTTNLTKRFPHCVALHNVDIDVRGGEVHAIFGENGAGKTTLVKILTGVYPADQGDIYIRGKKVSIRNPHHAQSLGISVVHQEISLIPGLSVVANLFLGHELRRGFLLNNDRMMKEARAGLNKVAFSLRINLDEQVGDLTLTDKRIIEIVRSLMQQDISVLILDESMQVLPEPIKPAMFNIIRELKSEGKGILYISRAIDEITNIADRVTILRDGTTVGVLRGKKDINAGNLLNSLLGVAFKRRATKGWPIDYVSSNIERQFGYRPDDFISNHKAYVDIIHDDDVKRVKQELKNLSAKGIDSIRQEYRILCVDGQYKWVRDSVEVIRD